MRKQRKKIRDLCRKNALISGSFKRLRFVIESLKKPQDRKIERDLENLKPIMELFPMKLFGQPLTDAEVKMLAKHAVYSRYEPGEVVREHGQFNDPTKEGFNIILKGKLQLQIPDPFENGIIEYMDKVTEVVQEEQEEKEEVQVVKRVQILSKE